jgi:hypothetical protein
MRIQRVKSGTAFQLAGGPSYLGQQAKQYRKRSVTPFIEKSAVIFYSTPAVHGIRRSKDWRPEGGSKPEA